MHLLMDRVYTPGFFASCFARILGVCFFGAKVLCFIFTQLYFPFSLPFVTLDGGTGFAWKCLRSMLLFRYEHGGGVSTLEQY